MEEFEDLLAGPDEQGRVDLSHRAWNMLDEAVWTWGKTLVILNISFNNLVTIPADIGNLVGLRELDCSCNKLEAICPSIGKLIRLKKLKANGNHITEIPHEIGKCKLLEEIILSENKIKSLPVEIEGLNVLAVLKLQNNQVDYFPPEYYKCLLLKDIDLTNNKMTNIPDALWINTPLILWLCKHNYDHCRIVDELEEANEELEMVQKIFEEEKIDIEDQIKALKDKNHALWAERPQKYLKFKKDIKDLGDKCSIM